MRVLAIDTALNACSVALADGDDVRAVLSEPMQRGHAERLAPMVQEVMARAGAVFDSIDRLVVTTGPGSFTGVRVGLAFARALALALAKPCAGVSTLEALALERGKDGLRGAMITAPSGGYFALYRDGAPLIAPAMLEQAALDAALASHPRVLMAASAVPDIAALARRGATLDPARHPPKPLYLRAPDAKPAAPRTVGA